MCKIDLSGGWKNENEIKKVCREKELLSSIHFVGRQKRTERFYSAFDAFLMPSIYEGLPLVGIEAQASGLPCFFSDNIDLQVLVSDRAKMYPLKMGATEWAKIILENKYTDVDRKSYADIICQKGYSIQNAVQELEKVYEI